MAIIKFIIYSKSVIALKQHSSLCRADQEEKSKLFSNFI